MFILGGKVLCGDVFSLMSKVDQLHHIETIEIQTVMEKFTDPFKEEKGSSAEGKKSTKSHSMAHQQEQKKKLGKNLLRTKKILESQKNAELNYHRAINN